MQFTKENKNRQWDYQSFGNMGTNLHPGQGNQLQQLNQMINTGAGGAEIITLQRNIWETIPKQHFEEMRRISILSGVEPSIHAPLVEPGLSSAGQGNTQYDEEHRLSEIRLVNDIIDKAIELADPRNPRNVPVNIHPDATARPTIWRLAKEDIKDDDGNVVYKKGAEYREVDWAVDKETGQSMPLKFEIKYQPSTKLDKKEHKTIWRTEDRLRNINRTAFEKEVTSAFGQSEFQLRQLAKAYEDDEKKGWTQEAGAYEKQIREEQQTKLAELFNDVKKNSDFEKANWAALPEYKKTKDLTDAKKEYDELKDNTQKEHEYVLKTIDEIESKFGKSKNDEERKALRAMEQQLLQKDHNVWSKFFHGLADNSKLTPKKFVTFDDFSVEKISDTFANAAIHSLEKAQEKSSQYAKQGVYINPLEIAPLVNIENMPANQFAFGRAESLKQLVEATRARTVDLLVKTKHMDKNEAEKIAEKIVGATWDVGHINMLRPSGFGDEQILNEARTIAPFVKHIHVTDNFGTTDAHLVPGQGNAIPKEQVIALKEAAAKSGHPLDPKVKEIMEIGGFIEQHKVSPWPYALAHFNSPIYETEAGPAWSEKSSDLGTNYFFGSSEYVAGAGNILPEAHFGMYGAGFSGLPTSFGSPIQGGDRSRFSGAPMS